MTELIADRNDIDFVIHEQFCLSDLSRHDRYSDFNKNVINMIIAEARNLAVKEILPTFKTGDEHGCRFESGKVTIPPGFKDAWEKLGEGEWFAPSQSPEWGGQGIPQTLNVMALNYLTGANLSLLMVAGLNNGVGKILEAFGTDEQKILYLKKLYSGQWAGTMMLTEAQAGSNLGDLSASAIKRDDGTYSLTGSKLFISGGDHDMTENIIHMVLARIEGAPAGSKGISLFLVPKYHIKKDGSLGASNDVICTGIEEKMGLHGSPTCSMAMGSKGECIGTLIGKENRGLSIMFLMMNHARLLVGLQGLACASSAYLSALQYARQRIQGIPPGSSDQQQTPLLHHPDIRQMLLTMKAYTEGSRSLIGFIAHLEDLSRITEAREKKKSYTDLIDFLIPICKGYVTEKSTAVCSLAIQVFGGYGYTSEFPVEQIYRDVRITSIYEGTNGIQAMDFLSRKLPMGNQNTLKNLTDRIREIITQAKEFQNLTSLSENLEQALIRLIDVSNKMAHSISGPDINRAYGAASLFADTFGDIVIAWMLLWRAVLANRKLKTTPKKKEIEFCNGQIQTAVFYMETILPQSKGKMDAVQNMSAAVTEISSLGFGGK